MKIRNINNHQDHVLRHLCLERPALHYNITTSVLGLIHSFSQPATRENFLFRLLYKKTPTIISIGHSPCKHSSLTSILYLLVSFLFRNCKKMRFDMPCFPNKRRYNTIIYTCRIVWNSPIAMVIKMASGGVEQFAQRYMFGCPNQNFLLDLEPVYVLNCSG